MDRRVISGAGSDAVGSTSDGSLPAITGYYGIVDRAFFNGVCSGALYAQTISGNHWAVWQTAGSGAAQDISFNAYLSATAYWRTDNQVHARNVKMYYIIKY